MMSFSWQILFFAYIIISSISIVQFSFADVQCGNQENAVDLKYAIHGSKVKTICFDSTMRNIVVSIIPESNGTLTIEIPRYLVNPVNIDCMDSSFSVLIDRHGINNYTEITSAKTIYSRTLSVPFNNENSEIRIIGVNTPEMIGYGETSCVQKISSPLKQISRGISPEKVMCPDNLVLIKKLSGSVACVKPQTAQKLVERGWGTIADHLQIQNTNNMSTASQAFVIIQKEVAVRSDVNIYVVDLQSITKYYGLQNALNETDKRYIPPTPCKSPCIGGGPYYAPPDTSYHFYMAGSEARLMINDPSFGFIAISIPSSDLKIYDTNIKLGNGTYSIRISGLT